MNRDKDIVEKLGGCWHEFNIGVAGYHYCIHCKVMSIYDFIANPDFTSDAGKIQLLRMMSKREDWYLFVHKIGKYNSGHFYSDYVEIDYIIGQTGKLRDAAWKWLKEVT